MKIKKLNKSALDKLEPEILNALKGINEKYGISFRFDSGTYDFDTASIKLSIVVKGAKTHAEKMFAKQVQLNNLDTTKIWKTKDKAFTLVGYNPRATKRCFTILDVNKGKEYVTTRENALKCFRSDDVTDKDIEEGVLTQTDHNGNVIVH